MNLLNLSKTSGCRSLVHSPSCPSRRSLRGRRSSLHEVQDYHKHLISCAIYPEPPLNLCSGHVPRQRWRRLFRYRNGNRCIGVRPRCPPPASRSPHFITVVALYLEAFIPNQRERGCAVCRFLRSFYERLDYIVCDRSIPTDASTRRRSCH